MRIISVVRRALQRLLPVIAITAITGCGGSVSIGKARPFSILSKLGLPVGFRGSGIDVEGPLAYVSTEAIDGGSEARSLVIIGLARPAAPTLASVTSSGLASDMGGIVVSGKYAYVPFEAASGTNFLVWDVSNPRSAAIAGSTHIACPAGMFPFQNPAIYGNYVYVSCWESEVTTTGAFVIVDVSNPEAPTVAGWVPVTATYQPISFAIWEESLYVAATQGGSTSDFVLLYSLAEPASPALIATETAPHSPQWVAAAGATALVPIYDGTELEAIDFSNPSSPRSYEVSLGTCRPMRAAVYRGNLALVTCDNPGGVAEVRVTAGADASYLGTALSGTVFNFVAASGPYLYAADDSGEFVTIGE